MENTVPSKRIRILHGSLFDHLLHGFKYTFYIRGFSWGWYLTWILVEFLRRSLPPGHPQANTRKDDQHPRNNHKNIDATISSAGAVSDTQTNLILNNQQTKHAERQSLLWRRRIRAGHCQRGCRYSVPVAFTRDVEGDGGRRNWRYCVLGSSWTGFYGSQA